MKESKQLKVTDLRIGDKVREKKTGFEFIVTGIIWDLLDEPTKAELYLDENDLINIKINIQVYGEI